MTELMKAAAKVSALNTEIENGQNELGQARETVARLETRLPILEDDLSEAEAELAVAAKNFKAEPEVTEAQVATFPSEPDDPDPVQDTEAPDTEGVTTLVKGSTIAGSVSLAGAGGQTSIPNEAVPVEEAMDDCEYDPDPLGTADAQIAHDSQADEGQAAQAMLNELDAEGDEPAF